MFVNTNGDLAKCLANFDRRLGTESFLAYSITSAVRHEIKWDLPRLSIASLKLDILSVGLGCCRGQFKSVLTSFS